MENLRKNIEGYISGASDKPKIEKTTKDWISEWFSSLLHTRKAGLTFIGLFTGSFVLYFLEPWGIAVPPILFIIQKMLAVLLFPIVSLMIFIFVIRTLGLASSFILPDIKAINIESSEKDITVFLENGKTDVFLIENIQSIILTYNFRGVYINYLNKKNVYTLSIEPVEIEKIIDVLGLPKKDVFFIDSKEGKIRSVRYTKN